MSDEKPCDADAGVARARRTCSTARRTGMRPMSAKARSSPRPASTPPRSSRIPRPTSMSRRNRSATGARCWCRIRPGVPMCWPNWSAPASRSTRTIRSSARLLEEMKEREAAGYAYESAERVVRSAGAAHARPRAGVFRRRAVRRQCRAALQLPAASASPSRWRW